ncbi:hypothetical protein FUAX_12880 [Fulvitalea axinellae]|uniref:Uncharacterized protein n=1 Tax=Fulvitalea axinellae TaxID=1182444 RepID=A0AAU9C9N6_9BACT|nr:hypothetical protein FUAX_12880 [Fulvitalea axinellae]
MYFTLLLRISVKRFEAGSVLMGEITKTIRTNT